MKFNIVLFEGTDMIKFGMTHEEVQKILGKKPELLKKSEFDLYMTEDYTGICHVFYDNLTCVAFEFFLPSQVFYNNIQLIGQEKENIATLFSNLEGYESKSDVISVFNNDFSVYAPFEHIESVYISRKGYYEEQYEFYKKAYDEKYKVSKSNNDRNIIEAAQRRTMIEEKMQALMSNLNNDAISTQVSCSSIIQKK